MTTMPSKRPDDPRRGKDRGATKVRAFRISDELWDAVLEKAKADAGAGVTTSDAVRTAFAAYVDKPEISGLAGSEMDRRSSAYRASSDE